VTFKVIHLLQAFFKCDIFTGSIARSASGRYLIYSEADFEFFFAQQGRHVAPMGVKFGMG